MFKKNKILSDNEIIAEHLRNAREEKKIKLKDAARKININLKYLKAIEKGDFDKLPQGTYGKSFIKEYSIFLGIDYNNLIRIYTKTLDKNQHFTNQNLKKTKKNELFSRQVIKSHNFINIPKILKSAIIIIIVLLCFIYLGICLKNIIFPPEIQIIEPKNNLIINASFINIIGLTEPGAEITINGEHILNNDEGWFTKKINLKNGINTITITAKKKYSRENIIKRQILVND